MFEPLTTGPSFDSLQPTSRSEFNEAFDEIHSGHYTAHDHTSSNPSLCGPATSSTLGSEACYSDTHAGEAIFHVVNGTPGAEYWAADPRILTCPENSSGDVDVLPAPAPLSFNTNLPVKPYVSQPPEDFSDVSKVPELAVIGAPASNKPLEPSHAWSGSDSQRHLK